MNSFQSFDKVFSTINTYFNWTREKTTFQLTLLNVERLPLKIKNLIIWHTKSTPQKKWHIFSDHHGQHNGYYQVAFISSLYLTSSLNTIPIVVYTSLSALSVAPISFTSINLSFVNDVLSSKKDKLFTREHRWDMTLDDLIEKFINMLCNQELFLCC